MSTPDDSHCDPDDPRLTAYALGELPAAAERAQVEALLAASPEARAELAGIRALTAALTAEYKQERLVAGDSPAPLPANVIRLPERRQRRLRPLLAMAAGLLLAGFLASLRLPVFNSVQVKGVRAKDQSVLENKDLSVAAGRVQMALPKPTSAPTLPVETAPAAPPTFELREQGSTAVNGKIAPPDSSDRYAGAITGTGGALLADASRRSGADRVTVTRSSVATSAKFGVAPAGTVKESVPAVTAGNRSGTFQPNSNAINELLFADAAKPGSPVTAIPASPARAKSEVATLSPAQLRTVAKVESMESSAEDAAASAKALRNEELSRVPDESFNTAAYDHLTETPFLAAKDNPLSTFSVDVDTASYSLVRRFIEQGSLPPAGAVRIEEMLNYFPYDYAPPAPGDERPFAIHLEGAACPWNPDHRLVRVALKGRELAQDKRPPSNLVFLIDVSGSMEPPERLPLIKESLRLLVERLTDNDRVAIVVYAGNSGLVLPSTNGAHKDTILRALDHLEAGGSTNGASGIKLAYKVAQENFLKGGTNRVILATDGDFNVGTTSQSELVRLIEKEAKGGVFLTALGVGTDNLKDSTMQKLADHGNGNYAYLDRLEEGKKVLVEQMSGTLVTIAKDVKIQVEFNPAAVNSYRLIGYEKRLLRKEDFNDDRVDAGEIGAGHSVTALYEVVPVGQPVADAAPAVDALKYQPVPDNRPTRATAQPIPAEPRELLTVKIRHKAPDSDTSERSYEAAFMDHGTAVDYANASPDFKFAAAVASFGLVLRDSPYRGNATLGAAIELAQESKGADATGYRAGFIELARRAQTLRRDGATGSR